MPLPRHDVVVFILVYGGFRSACWNPAGQTYHIPGSATITARQLVEGSCSGLGVRFAGWMEIIGERLGKEAARMLGSTKLRETPFWYGRISLDATLDHWIEWVRSNLEQLKHQPFDCGHQA